MAKKALPSSKRILIVLRGLQGKTTISKYCAEKGIPRSSFYRWRAEMLATLATVMENETKLLQRKKTNKK